MSMPHICSVQHETSRTYLPYKEDTKNVFQRFSRCLRHWTLVWRKHPQFSHYYKSTTAYLEERKIHASSRYFYIIHPMSRLCFAFEMIIMVSYPFAFRIQIYNGCFVSESKRILCFFGVDKNKISSGILEYRLLFFGHDIRLNELFRTRRFKWTLRVYNFAFEMIMMLSYPFAFLYYPLAASFFNLDYQYFTHSHATEKVFQFIFMMEMVARLFIGRKNFRLKRVTINHRKILKSYCSNILFIGDLCGALPVSYVLFFTHNAIILSILPALRFLKALRLGTFISYSNDLFKVFHLAAYKGITNFMMITGLCFHWFTCAYFGIKRIRLITTESTIAEIYKYQAKNVSGSTYIETAFRTMGVLISARRDSSMSAAIEHKILCCLFLLCGRVIMLVLGVLLINQILRSAELDIKYRDVLGQLNEFMSRKKLPVATRNRLLSFYEYKFQGKFVKERKVENILSDRLKKEINYHASNKLINQVQIFEDIPTKILEDILSHLKLEVFLPNDIIISAGSPAECMYFISSGTVSVATASGREVCHLQDGGYFGEAALVLNQKKSMSNVTALEICETYRLDAKTFRHCFRSNPEVFLRLKAVAEKRDKETTKLEEEFQEKLFLRTYFGDKRRNTFQSNQSEEDLNSVSSRKKF